jgi:hypothetical protein
MAFNLFGESIRLLLVASGDFEYFTGVSTYLAKRR